MSRPILLGLPYSPWSEKARFVLDRRGVDYEYRVYAPIVGEPALRFQTKNFSSRVSVPVLFDEEGKAIADSANIARWADGKGSGPTLFPAEHAAEIDRYIELSELALTAGRTIALHRVLDDDDSLLEMVPRPLRGVRALGSAIGAFGVRRTLRKYELTGIDRPSAIATIEKVLAELREALAKQPASSGPRTLLGTFSFADITMTQIFAFIAPPKFGLEIGTANRGSFTDVELCARHADLVQWRDAIYDTYRPR